MRRTPPRVSLPALFALLFALLAAPLATVTACSGSSSPSQRAAGQGCGGGAGDCASGLSCLPFATFAADGGCTPGPDVCTIRCNADADCASLGAKFVCFAGCAGTKTCGATP